MDHPQIHYDIADNAVMISGIVRSGTSMLGKIVGSLDNVEYSYEPPLAFTVDHLLKSNKIDSALSSQLLRTYFSEDIVLNYHQGRGYNMRPTDESCIFNMKEYSDVLSRWHDISNVLDAANFAAASQSRLVFKTPIAYSLAKMVISNYKNAKIIEIDRNLRDVFSSIKVKNWFKQDSLSNEIYPAMWPFFAYEKGGVKLTIPYYIDPHNIQSGWAELSEDDKILYLLIAAGKYKLNFMEFIETEGYGSKVLYVKYEDLLTTPDVTMRHVVFFAGIEYGKKTQELVSAIIPRERKYDVDLLFKNCDSYLLSQFNEVNERLGY